MQLNIVLSVGLWLSVGFTLLTVYCLWKRQTDSATSPGRFGAYVFGIMACVALAVLLRPHEDWLGGQDGGAYINLGARFAHESSPFYIDPLLDHLKPGEFDAFRYYAHNTGYLTKYGTEWVRDPERGRTGPWFQPAFPLLLSLVVRLFGPWGSAFVIPCFAWFNGWMLGMLVFCFSRSRLNAMMAAVLYWFNPLVIWHGRAPRPEFVASFFVLGGILFLCKFIQNEERRIPRLWLGAIAGLCFALAPFFHITSWNAAIPAAVFVSILLLRGHRELALYPPVVVGGGLLFCVQLVYGCDTYGLKRRVLDPLLTTMPGLIAIGVGGAVVTALYAWCLCRKPVSLDAQDGDRSLSVRILASVAMVGLLVLMTVWAALTRPTVEMHYVQSFINRTDLITASVMVSCGLSLIAALGLVMLSAWRKRKQMRVVMPMLLILLPPALLVGNMYDFFMTRYLITAWIPLLVIGLAVVGGWLGARANRRFRPAISVFYVVVLLLFSLWPRKHWITTCEYRGYFSEAASVAAPILQSGGMLLVEYSRLGAIFDHAFDIPTLGINNERIDDHLQEIAEKAWVELMHRFPDRPAYLLSPYSNPASERFSLHPVDSWMLNAEVLQTQRWGLPTGVSPWTMGFYLYRMYERPEFPEPPVAELYRREMDDGRFGIRGFDRPDYRQWGVLKLRDTNESGYNLHLARTSNDEPMFLHFFYYSEDSAVPPVLRTASTTISLDVQEMLPDWYWGRCRLPANMSDVQLVPQKPILLNAIWQETAQETLCLRPNDQDIANTEFEKVSAFGGRSGQAGAEIHLPPALTDSPVALFLLLPEEVGNTVGCRVQSSAGTTTTKQLPTGRWMWTVWHGLTVSNTAVRLEFALDLEDGERQTIKLPCDVVLGGVAVGSPL